MKFIRIDLHSNCFTACILDDERNKQILTYDINRDSLLSFYSQLDQETHVLVEASTNTFSFVSILKPFVKSISVANPYKLKLISVTSKKTDKVDAHKLALFLKMQISSGVTLIEPVYVPDDAIQELRSCFTTYKQLRKQIGATKNRIHSLLKQDLRPYTKQYIFGKKTRKEILSLGVNAGLKFQLELLFSHLESAESHIKKLEEHILVSGSRYYHEIEILTSMKGLSVFTALAIIADM